MLKITIPPLKNHWDETTEQFLNFDGCELELEHSLYTVSIWEGITHKPFVGETHTNEELLLYIRCMCLNDVPDEALMFLTEENLETINAYISDDHTATTIREDIFEQNKKDKHKEFVTNELLYCYMITLGIPVEFEHWHLGRLIMLIRVCNEKNKEAEEKAKNHNKKGRSRLSVKEQRDLAARYHEINERRKAEWGTKG